MKSLLISFVQALANVVLIAVGIVALIYILTTLMTYAETVLYCLFAFTAILFVLSLMPRNIDIKNKIQRIADLLDTINVGIH